MHASDLTILFDNATTDPATRSLWGFSALVHCHGTTLLFDTGSNGRVLLENMQRLGVRPDDLDLLFLSHPHWDHIGGADSILERNPGLTCVIHDGFERHMREDLARQCASLKVVDESPCELAPGLHSTGRMPSEPGEHGLIIDTGAGFALVTGCAHPGIVSMVEQGIAVADRRIRWVIGGFHLEGADDGQLAAIAQQLQSHHVETILPTHCTGEQGIAACRRHFGEHCLPGGIGQQLCFVAAGDQC